MSPRHPGDAPPPYLRVRTENGDCHYLAASEAERLDTALDDERMWFTGTTVYDMAVRIRIEDVSSVETVTPTVYAQERAFFAILHPSPDDPGDAWKGGGA